MRGFSGTNMKEISQINIIALRTPTDGRQRSWLFTSVTEESNLGLPRTTRVCTLFQKQFSRPFQDFFRTQIDFSRTPKCTIIEAIIPYKNNTAEICFKRKLYYKSLKNSRTCITFPGLSSPGKCQNKIPGFPGPLRTLNNSILCSEQEKREGH